MKDTETILKYIAAALERKAILSEITEERYKDDPEICPQCHGEWFAFKCSAEIVREELQKLEEEKK